VSAEADHRYLSIAFGLIVGFMVVEVGVAVVSGSLALFADAGHMLADVGAIAGSLWALRLAQRPASNKWSFGLKRAEILAAAVNGVTLLVVGMLVMFEGVRRLVDPPAVKGVPLVVVAVIGVAVNVAATWVLAKANRGSLNVEGAFRHILTDLYGFIGTAIAGVVVITTGWRRADPVASLVVVVLVLRAAWGLLRASGHVLLKGTPEAVDLDDVRRHITELPEVLSVHESPRVDAHIRATRAQRPCGGHRSLPRRWHRGACPRPLAGLPCQPFRRGTLDVPA
jgi:cobalt-zinc-cadmium efflux system protein